MDFTRLEETGVLRIFSDIGRDIELPQGIFHWSGRAAKEATINATIGSAVGHAKDFLPGGGDERIHFHLPSVMKHFHELGSEQVSPYAPILGLPNLRKAWKDWVSFKLDETWPVDPDLLGSPMVVPGSTAGIYFLAKLFLSPGELILCNDRRWENYDTVFNGALGLRIGSFPLFENGKLAPDKLRDKLIEVRESQQKWVVVLNFPNNPTGYSPTREEADALCAVLVDVTQKYGKKMVVIFDDAYDRFVYDDSACRTSLFGALVGKDPNLIPIKVDGMSKEFFLYGGRVSCVTFGYHPAWGDPKLFEAEMENKFGALLRGSVSNCNRAIQEAVARTLADRDAVVREQETIFGILRARWAAMRDALAEVKSPGMIPDPFNAGFFCLLNVPESAPCETLADHLLRNYRIGIIPIRSAPHGINAVRAAFCSVEKEQIPELVKGMAAGVADLTK